MPWWRIGYWHWRDRLGARPGESREHAEMRSNRSHRKRLRKLRRRQEHAFGNVTAAAFEAFDAETARQLEQRP